jgi:hypothetical protein
VALHAEITVRVAQFDVAYELPGQLVDTDIPHETGTSSRLPVTVNAEAIGASSISCASEAVSAYMQLAAGEPPEPCLLQHSRDQHRERGAGQSDAERQHYAQHHVE